MYQHTQSGSPTIWFLALSGVIPLGLLLSGAASDPLARVVLWAALVVLIACGWLFSSLTVTINGTKLAWRFGPGLIRKAVPIKNIERAARVRAPALAGWGIHWTPRGWLYNVSGVEAVHIQLRDGKQFLLGTDEADQLLQALEHARSEPPT